MGIRMIPEVVDNHKLHFTAKHPKKIPRRPARRPLAASSLSQSTGLRFLILAFALCGAGGEPARDREPRPRGSKLPAHGELSLYNQRIDPGSRIPKASRSAPMNM